MNILEIIGIFAVLFITGVALMWIAIATARPTNGGVVQKRKPRIIKWEDRP